MRAAVDRVAVAAAAVAAVVALAGARDHAGSWNDASHLAAAGSLVDRGTLAIDQSIFVKPADGPSPFREEHADLRRGGTRDRVFVGGRYYSDKPPVVSILLAGLYGVLRAAIGLDADSEPRRFVWWMTLGSAGLCYVLSVWWVARLGQATGLPERERALLAAAFGLSTLAPVYARAVNQHEMLLATAAALLLVLVRAGPSGPGPGRSAAAGALAGLGYALDLGAGPPLLGAAFTLVSWQTRSARRTGLFVLAALPPVALHHGVTWWIGGVLAPLNSVPEYLRWPGSPFDESNMTGVARHSPAGLAVYAAALLFGKHGFLLHDLPLLWILPGLAALRRPAPERPVLAMAGLWGVATWALYAVFSDNYAGACVSIRWFVPTLAAGALALAVLLREQPERIAGLAVLTAFGAILAGIAWWVGPWTTRMVPFYWPVVGGGLLSWLAISRRPATRREANARRRPTMAP